MTPYQVIKQYIQAHDMFAAEFCRVCDIAYSTLYGYSNGEKIHEKIAKRIEEKTGGEIKYEQLTDKPRKK